MSQPDAKIRRPILDIKPANITGNLVVATTEPVGPKIDLKRKERREEAKRPEAGINHLDDLIARVLESDFVSDVKEEFEAVLQRDGDPLIELASIGARIYEPRGDKTRQSLIVAEDEEFYQKVIKKIREPILSHQRLAYTPEAAIKKEEVKQDARVAVASFYQKSRSSPEYIKGRPLDFSPSRRGGFWKKWFFIFIGLTALLGYGLTLKHELVKESNSAFQNLDQAGDNLKTFNFTEAARSFQQAYDDFSQAGEKLDIAGSHIGTLLAELPGAGKLKSAKHLVETGKLLARAGQAMSEVMSTVSKTGSILNPTGSQAKPSKIIGNMKNALILSGVNLEKVKLLLADVDDGIIPEEKRGDFVSFKDKIPLFEKLIADSLGYAEFLENLVGLDEPRKYLLLFQNYSELRPAGGFPGTYGVVSFDGGGLTNFFVDDVYNLDGQLKRNIIPPRQIQHITPTWGMRDAGWFIDFPSSAKKTMWFFGQEAGYGVDGVIALNPDVISRILEVIGPVKLSDYDITLTAENFLASIQEEVEYGENRIQPKKIVVDFAPRLLEKLYSAEPEKWLEIFKAIMAGLEEKDILMYFEDQDLRSFAAEKGFSGEVKKTKDDYLMVTFSNVKGSKTDVVTDSSVAVDTKIESGKVEHKVTIKRQHNGGAHQYGFYNRQNPAYVRILVPEGAELLKISGNDSPNFRPLISYSGGQFEKDRDLENLESGAYFDKGMGVSKYEESGKKGFGFWMITETGTTKTVELEYVLPFDYAQGQPYRFYFQKQPGLDWKNFRFSLREPEGRPIVESLPSLNKIGSLHMLDSELKKDLEINIKFK